MTLPAYNGPFVDRLLTLRFERNWSQSDVSRRVGVSTASISRLENGNRNPSARLLERLARLYGISMDELWGTAS
jgi:transcriptional regulator with XRE-family HTH domain